MRLVRIHRATAGETGTSSDMFLGGAKILEQNFEKSSSISRVVHDSVVDSLEVHFKNGGVYRYYEVSRETAYRLIRAESVGQWFAKYIKPNYGFTKVLSQQTSARRGS